MPNRRKTAQELALSGAAKKNPARYVGRGEAPSGKRLGRPPTHLIQIERRTWNEIAKAAPPGLLTQADRFALELAAKIVAKTRTTTVRASELNILTNLLSKLGLTPTDRQRLAITPPAPTEPDEWEGF